MSPSQGVQRLLTHLQIHEDKNVRHSADFRLVTLYSWNLAPLDLAATFEVTPDVERVLAGLSSSDTAALFPDRSPEEAGLALFLVHLEESLATRNSGSRVIDVYPGEQRYEMGDLGAANGTYSVYAPHSGQRFKPDSGN